MDVNLEICPFCGGTARLRENTECFGKGDTITSHFIVCERCYASSQEVLQVGLTSNECISIAAEMWNRRI